jgi:hypothetical protein
MAKIRKRFSLFFSMENAAFVDRPASSEILRILNLVGDSVAKECYRGLVFDINGNRIGEFSTSWPNDGTNPEIKAENIRQRIKRR